MDPKNKEERRKDIEKALESLTKLVHTLGPTVCSVDTSAGESLADALEHIETCRIKLGVDREEIRKQTNAIKIEQLTEILGALFNAKKTPEEILAALKKNPHATD